MAISASRLRENVYRILDRVLETGIPVEVDRRGRRLLITAVEGRTKIDRLESHPAYLLVDPDDIVHTDWSQLWEGERELGVS